ncbi:MAG: family hydrolase [Acidobacteriaceae bacterium]|jgi:sugar-phosphatase|nr:family hydrolase [Acidobacteriaceae bacterium]
MTIYRCSAILFDLDGVLVDSTKSVSRQWRLWAEERHVDPDEVLRVAHGVRTIEVLRIFAPHLDAEAEVRRVESREADDIDGVAVMPGAAALLRSIPPKSWCVVTSGTRHLATKRLQHASLPAPNVLISADDVVKGKPDPEPYLKGASLLGMKPEDCLVIEDAPVGIRAAHAGGMKAIGLTSTFVASKLAEADSVVRGLAQIQVRSSAAGKLEVSIGDL